MNEGNRLSLMAKGKLRIFNFVFPMGPLSLLSFFAALVGCSTTNLSNEELLERAAALCDRGRGDEALFVLEQLRESTFERPRLYYLQGVANELLQDFELAKQSYDRCLEIMPDHSDALNNRGVVHARLGNLEQSIADLTHAIQLNPTDALALANLALAYHDQGEYQASISNYEKSLAIDRNSQVLLQLGNVYLDQKSFEDAEKQFTEALNLEPQRAPIYLNRASARIALGRMEDALADLETAKNFDVDNILHGAIQQAKEKIANSAR